MSGAPDFDDEFRARLEDLIRWRRDVRRFRRKTVDPKLVPHLLELADLTPSVGLSHGGSCRSKRKRRAKR